MTHKNHRAAELKGSHLLPHTKRNGAVIIIGEGLAHATACRGKEEFILIQVSPII